MRSRVQITQVLLLLLHHHHLHHGELLQHGTRGSRRKEGCSFIMNLVLKDLSPALHISCSSPPNLQLKNITGGGVMKGRCYHPQVDSSSTAFHSSYTTAAHQPLQFLFSHRRRVTLILINVSNVCSNNECRGTSMDTLVPRLS